MNNIRNLQELEEARLEIRKRLQEREQTLQLDLSRIKDMAQPMNLFALGLHAVSPAETPLDQVALSLVRRLKARISKL